jgi:hypothetical protein
MKKIQIILLVIIVIGIILIFTQKFWVDPLVNFILRQQNTEQINEPAAKNDPLNITFAISGENYTLVNGKAEKEIVPGSATKEVVMVFGRPVYGDLNGDKINDAAMLLTQNLGGSGTFFYVVEAINDGGEFKGTNAMLLGDRIAPQNLKMENGRVVVNFAERKISEPMSTPPSVGKSVWVQYDKKTGQIGEWAKNFEGESAN